MDKHRFPILGFLHICLAFAYVQHAKAQTISTTAATTTNRYTTVQTTTVAQSTSINSITFPSTTKAVDSTPTMLAQTTTAASPSIVAQTTIKSQSTIVSPTTTISSVTQTTTTFARTTAVSTTNTAISSVAQTRTTTVAGTGTTASTTSPASPSTISLASTTTAPAITVTSPTSRPLTSDGVPTTLTTNVLSTTKGNSATTADISTTTTTLRYCLSNPCQNGGSCIENATVYTCNCVPGYTNANCEIEINECATLPCYSFGTCTDKINDYNCSCNAGFTSGTTDKLCNEIDECRTNNVSCQNHGICHDYINTFQCQCPLAQDGTAKYYGNFCEKDGFKFPPISGVSKAFGILSGGAALTFYGTDLDRLPPFGVNFTNGIGKPLFGYVKAESIQPTSFVVLTPKAREDLIDVELMLVVIFSGGSSQNLTLKYHYVDNPGVVDITPRVQLATGGILLTVMGTNFDAAVTAIMTVTLQLFNHSSLISTQSYRQVCSALNGTAMNCRLPYFDLPPTFFDTNATATTQKPVVKRRRREIQRTSAAALKLFHSLKNFLGNIYTVVFRDERADTSLVKKLRRRRSGPTASLNASDGIVAKMYLGFIFDNDPTYENISKSLPNITFNLITQGPRFNPTDNEQDQVFDPNKQELLQIKAKNLTLGCSKSDYNVSVGAGVCNVSALTDNVLTCFPPVETPPVNEDTLKNCRSNDDDSNYLAVMVRVSKFENFAFCVEYSEADSMNWVIGVCVGCGCGLLLLLITVAVSVKIHRHIRKRKSRTTRPGIDPPPEPNRVYGRLRGQSGSNGDHGPTLTRDASVIEMRSYRSGRSRAFGIAPFLAFGKRISYTRQNPERGNGNRYYDTQVIPENDNSNDRDYSVQTPSHLRRMTDQSTGDNSRPRVGSPEVEKWGRRPMQGDDDGRGMQGGEHKWKFNYPNVDSEYSTSLSKDYLNHNELINKEHKYYGRHGM